MTPLNTKEINWEVMLNSMILREKDEVVVVVKQDGSMSQTFTIAY